MYFGENITTLFTKYANYFL